MLLRNRVRMLEQEHQKAQRKIDETNDKATKLEQIKEENEKNYLRTIQEMERKHHRNNSQSYHLERRNRQNLIDNAKIEIYNSKKREVQEMKQRIQDLRAKKAQDDMSELQAKKVKKEVVQKMINDSARSVQNYMSQKQNALKQDFHLKII